MDEKDNTSELVVVDVKRYKKVKKALEESEERFRQLFENVPIGIYRTTPDGRIVDANPALVSMLGYISFAELAGRNLEKDPPSAADIRARDFVKHLQREGEIKGLEATWKRKDGSLIHVRENAKLVRGESGRCSSKARSRTSPRASRPRRPSAPHPAARDPQLHHRQGQLWPSPCTRCWRSSWTAGRAACFRHGRHFHVRPGTKKVQPAGPPRRAEPISPAMKNTCPSTTCRSPRCCCTASRFSSTTPRRTIPVSSGNGAGAWPAASPCSPRGGWSGP